MISWARWKRPRKADEQSAIGAHGVAAGVDDLGDPVQPGGDGLLAAGIIDARGQL